MSYYNLCGIGSQHSNISKGKGGVGVHIKITGMQDYNQGKELKYQNCLWPIINPLR
jgi:hypothetical protein